MSSATLEVDTHTRSSGARMMDPQLLLRIERGRTDLVLALLEEETADAMILESGVAWMNWVAYYGDVSALRLLVGRGLALDALGANFGLDAAAFHGHWQLCEYLIELGARPGFAAPDTGETALHSALTNENRERYDLVVKVLLAAGADPNAPTNPGVPTGSFMRDARTRGETPLHRAALFGSPDTISLLLAAGASLEATDAAGESALAWASWARRPTAVLRLLLYGEHTLPPEHVPLRRRLLGEPGLP